jgi:glutathione S-transferase
MSAEDALAVARTCEPAAPRPSRRQKEDPVLGSLVEIRADDYAQDLIVGSLDFLDDDEVSIRISNDRVGHVAVHFPRIGFELRPAGQPRA